MCVLHWPWLYPTMKMPYASLIASVCFLVASGLTWSYLLQISIGSETAEYGIWKTETSSNTGIFENKKIDCENLEELSNCTLADKDHCKSYQALSITTTALGGTLFLMELAMLFVASQEISMMNRGIRLFLYVVEFAMLLAIVSMFGMYQMKEHCDIVLDIGSMDFDAEAGYIAMTTFVALGFISLVLWLPDFMSNAGGDYYSYAIFA